MSKIVWDQIGEKIYETGADRAVLYLVDSNNTYSNGVAWNGLLGVDENPSGAEATKLWADNINYATMFSAEEYGFTIRAYTYPDEFEQCDGSINLVPGAIIHQQARKVFGFAYRTKIGNDTVGDDYGYKLHLVYGCKASPSSKTHDTVNDSPSAVEMSWEVTCTPVPVTNLKPTCVIEVDSTMFKAVADAAKLEALEDALYGTSQTDAYLPLPDDVKTILSGGSVTPPVVEDPVIEDPVIEDPVDPENNN